MPIVTLLLASTWMTDEQVLFQLTYYRNVFRDLQKAFQNSHYSWQNL